MIRNTPGKAIRTAAPASGPKSAARNRAGRCRIYRGALRPGSSAAPDTPPQQPRSPDAPRDREDEDHEGGTPQRRHAAHDGGIGTDFQSEQEQQCPDDDGDQPGDEGEAPALQQAPRDDSSENDGEKNKHSLLLLRREFFDLSFSFGAEFVGLFLGLLDQLVARFLGRQLRQSTLLLGAVHKFRALRFGGFDQLVAGTFGLLAQVVGLLLNLLAERFAARELLDLLVDDVLHGLLGRFLHAERDLGRGERTAYADIDLAVRGIKEGATDFVVKPWNNQKLVETLLNAVSASETKSPANGPNAGRTAESSHLFADTRNMYWGNSPAMQQLRLLVEKVASTDANILITGENGTGKEMLAREIHSLSPRNRQDMVSVDMGAVTESLFESELFGHVKGSFTDAHADRAGKFEAASRSTLFLDEIGNLPYHLQAKLLTAIQRRSIVRVGSNTPIPVDIRLICATNRNLPEMVAKGEFREDLLYRINTIHLEIPSLRERPEDIIPLAELFIARFCKQYDKPPVKLTDGACEKLTLHPWYGNIRELEHAIEKAIIICDNETLPAELFQLARRTGTPEAAASTLEEMEMQMIRKTLDKCSGNLSAVAAQLGITRQTLYNKMKKYGL